MAHTIEQAIGPPGGIGKAARRRRLSRILNHPALLASTSLALFVSSLHEVVATAEEFRLGTHHGLLVYSFLQLSRILPDFWDGVSRAGEVVDEVVDEVAGPKGAAGADRAA